jgi:hypothetical protein
MFFAHIMRLIEVKHQSRSLHDWKAPTVEQGSAAITVRATARRIFP